VAERLKAAVLKTARLERASRVRIPPPPPLLQLTKRSAESIDATRSAEIF
jgi:hypothetical protein